MRVVFVLVEPQTPENVGAAARALKTMGFDSLRVVNSDAHLQPAARWVAHGSAELLERAEQFAALADAVADCDLVVGTSAKPRGRVRRLLAPRELAGLLGARGPERVAVVFGREDRGLSNEELDRCQLLSSVPLAVSYPSLNLGQAVMLYAYELSGQDRSAGDDKPVRNPDGQRAALTARVEALLGTLDVGAEDHLRQWLMQRLAMAEAGDLRFLHSLCTLLEQRL